MGPLLQANIFSIRDKKMATQTESIYNYWLLHCKLWEYSTTSTHAADKSHRTNYSL